MYATVITIPEENKELELLDFSFEVACGDVVFQVVICFQNEDF